MTMRELTVKTLTLITYVIDVIIWLIGILLAAAGAFTFYYAEEMTKVTNDEIYPIAVVIIAIGVILIVTASLGICGVCKKTSALLSGYIAAMILILLAQFAAVVICFTFEASVHYYLTQGMTHSFAFYGKTGTLSSYTRSIDFMQEYMKCCGLNGPSDYSDVHNATFWVNDGNATNVPDTCCLKALKKAGCGIGQSKNADKAKVHVKGCYKSVLSYIEMNLTIIGTAALIFMFIQLANIFINILLQRRFKEHEDYQLSSTKLRKVKKIDDDVAQDKKDAEIEKAAYV